MHGLYCTMCSPLALAIWPPNAALMLHVECLGEKHRPKYATPWPAAAEVRSASSIKVGTAAGEVPASRSSEELQLGSLAGYRAWTWKWQTKGGAMHAAWRQAGAHWHT